MQRLRSQWQNWGMEGFLKWVWASYQTLTLWQWLAVLLVGGGGWGLSASSQNAVALLVVQAEVANSELLLATVGVVVLVSVAIHGGMATPISAWYGRKAARETLAEERESTAAGLFGHHEDDVPRVTPEELNRLLAEPNPPVVLDVRSHSSYEQDQAQIPGSLRVLPDHINEWTPPEDEQMLVVAYCT